MSSLIFVARIVGRVSVRPENYNFPLTPFSYNYNYKYSRHQRVATRRADKRDKRAWLSYRKPLRFTTQSLPSATQLVL